MAEYIDKKDVLELSHCAFNGDCTANLNACKDCNDRIIRVRDIAEIPTVNAIVISDNATNGEMIKAMFPNIPLGEDDFLVRKSRHKNTDYWKAWWNSPYRKEKRNESKYMWNTSQGSRM